MNFWPFNRKPSEERLPPSPSLAEGDPWNFLDSKQRRILIGREERRAVFQWTEQLIFEFVPEEFSSDPTFRDDFFYLSAQLQSFDNPGIIELVDVGEDSNRLYRAWKQRNFFPAFLAFNRTKSDEAKAFIPLLETLEGLYKIAPSLARPPHQTLSTDEVCHFIARPPQTLKRERTFQSKRDIQQPVHSLLFHEIDEPELLSPDLAYQFALGTHVWLKLTDEFPYNLPPLARFKGKEVSRQHNEFGDALSPVLYRLTELEPTKRYPTLPEALKSLRRALLSYAENVGS